MRKLWGGKKSKIKQRDAGGGGGVGGGRVPERPERRGKSAAFQAQCLCAI